MTWQNVVVNAAVDKTFDPPLDAIYITTAANGGGSLKLYVNGVDSGLGQSELTANLHLQIGHITGIDGASNALRYIGIRKLPSSTFGVINDT